MLLRKVEPMSVEKVVNERVLYRSLINENFLLGCIKSQAHNITPEVSNSKYKRRRLTGRQNRMLKAICGAAEYIKTEGI